MTKPQAGRRARLVDLSAVAILSAVLAAGGTYALTDVGVNGPTVTNTSGTVAADTSTGAPNANPASYAGNVNWGALADQVSPSVVSIQVLTTAGGGEGSGVIWDDQGHIVTNAHVVAGGEKVRVTLSDGRSYAAEVTGTDPSTDLAVLEVTDAPDDLLPIATGDDAGVRVGNPVMAIGNPLGLSGTVTTGIISALDRPVSTAPLSANDPSGGVVTNAIQTSAAINPGNSGGALVNAQGELVGINSAIASLPTGGGSQSGSIGIGFAIPVNLTSTIVDQLITKGVAEHAFLGVSLTEGEDDVDGATLTGATVTQVEPGSPAQDAGLEAGDVITAIDGERVPSSTALVAQVRERASGAQAKVGYLRNGSRGEVTLTLDTRPDTSP